MELLGHKVNRDQKEKLDRGELQETLVILEHPALKATRGQQDHQDQPDHLESPDLLELPDQTALSAQSEILYVNHMFV